MYSNKSLCDEGDDFLKWGKRINFIYMVIVVDGVNNHGNYIAVRGCVMRDDGAIGAHF